MAASSLPLAPSVATAPDVMPAYRELCEVIVAYQTEIFKLKAKVSQYEASAVYVTDAMHGALQASKLEHALRALVATERGRRVLGTAVRPARGDEEFNVAAAAVRRILEL